VDSWSCYELNLIGNIMNVYFIRAGEHGAIKIGVAKNVKARLDQLQTGNHQDLQIIHVIEAKGEAHAFNLEAELHNIYKHENIRGEWFKSYINFESVTKRLGYEMPRNHVSDKRNKQKKLNQERKRAKRIAKKILAL
jgi:predicted GIY-YIG superfamily endonuclease